MYDVFFIDKFTGWAVGGNVGSEFIIKSGDSGITWSILKESSQYQWLTGVYFINANQGWAVGYKGVILHTTDGGSSWEEQSSGTDSYLRKVKFSSSGVGFAIGENGTILKYSDKTNGISIIHPNGGEVLTTGSTYNIEWNSQGVIDVKIQLSTNNGNSWESIVDSINSTGIYDWAVPNIISSQCKIKITDINNIQMYDISNSNFSIQSSKFISVLSPNGGEIFDGESVAEITWTSNNVLSVKIEYSLNNGASWNLITDNYQSTGIYDWSVPNLSTIQARIRISDLDLPSISDMSNGNFRINKVTALEEESEMINQYNLYQNYPNPFNPTTTINFQIPKASNVVLKVLDVLGKDITVLVDEEKSAGKYNVTFNAKDLPSGVYFCRIQAGKFTETKKLMLMK